MCGRCCATNWWTIASFWVCLACVKVIHEFGHGLTAKHFGGEVHEMGILFLVLTPALYCDVTDSWLAKHGSLKLRASRTRRVGPERFEVKGLVELFDSLDGKREVGDIVEAHEDRADPRKLNVILWRDAMGDQPVPAQLMQKHKKAKKDDDDD